MCSSFLLYLLNNLRLKVHFDQRGVMKKSIVIVVLMMSPILFSFGSKSKEETPETPEYIEHYNAGVKAQDAKNYSEAIEHYQTAIDLKSDFADAWNNLGYCNRMIAKSYLVKAGDAYDKALKYHPELAEAIEYQGEYFVMVGQLKDAYQNYRKLKKMNSDESDELKAKLDDVLKQAQSVLKVYSP
jgi:tetratricopeptide (TPR) repeat protein